MAYFYFERHTLRQKRKAAIIERTLQPVMNMRSNWG